MVFPDVTLQSIKRTELPYGASLHDVEMMQGEIVEEMPSMLHSYISQMLSLLIGMYLRQHPIGYVLPEARYQMPDDEENALIPDISYVPKRKAGKITDRTAPYMPDLAIEVQSQGQNDQFMHDKGRLYLQKGVQMVWLIYSTQQIVEVLTPTTRQLLTIKDTLTAGDLLPGLVIAIAELFPPEDEAD